MSPLAFRGEVNHEETRDRMIVAWVILTW